MVVVMLNKPVSLPSAIFVILFKIVGPGVVEYTIPLSTTTLPFALVTLPLYVALFEVMPETGLVTMLGIGKFELELLAMGNFT
jgi:hypothetical protein